jgi:hypothetical protein
VAEVRIDAGLPSAALLAGLDARGIDCVSYLRANPVCKQPGAVCGPFRPQECRSHFIAAGHGLH